MTSAEQAAESAKNLNFEKVWAALMETRHQFKDTEARFKDTEARFKDTEARFKDLEARFKDTRAMIKENGKQMKKSQDDLQKKLDESQKRIEKSLSDLSKNLGGLGNMQGRLTEAMFSEGLWEKFRDIGFQFTTQAQNKKFTNNGMVIIEADFFLENGDYAMPVEIKTELTVDDVDDHIIRIQKIRDYMDAKNDNRKLMGAVGGEIVHENVMRYAQKKGFYVLTQSGESVVIASIPENFKPQEW